MTMDPGEFARHIDHTNVKPEATEKDIEALCHEAIKHGFASACMASCWAGLARKLLGDSGIRVCCVVGFPFGSQPLGVKAFEAARAVRDGAEEIDAVINIGYLKSGLADGVRQDIAGIVDASAGAAVKVIIEACYLTDEEKVLASKIARDAGAAFVKTSTGYGPEGADIEDVRLIKKEVPGIMVKASGGIRTYEDATKFLAAGASRIGTSSGPKIMEHFR
jgi:deoxyribose-phosphate aldolase